MAGKVGAGLPHSKKTPARMPALQLEIEGTLLMQESEIAEDVLRDFLRLGFGIDFLQIHNDLLDSVLAVAALDNLEAWAVEAQRALRHEQDALLIVFAKAASWSQARAAVQPSAGGCSVRAAWQVLHDSFAGWKAPGGGQPGLT